MTDVPKPHGERPTHGTIRVGKALIRVKIRWDLYDPKKPDQFVVESFHKQYTVQRSRLTFAPNHH